MRDTKPAYKKMKTSKFALKIYGKNTIVDIFNTREEAIKALQEQEEVDMDEGIYQPGYYEIREVHTY